MSISFRLPRRTPKPGRHTIAAVRSQKANATEETARFPVPLGMPGLDTALCLPWPSTSATAPTVVTTVQAPEPQALEPPPAPAETAAMTQALAPVREALREAATARPATPADLERVADRLRTLPPAVAPPAEFTELLDSLPAAYLRDVVAGQPATHEPLRGHPAFAGTDRTPNGALAAGVWLGDADGCGRFVLDGFDPDWFRAGATAFTEAAEALEAARSEAA